MDKSESVPSGKIAWPQHLDKVTLNTEIHAAAKEYMNSTWRSEGHWTEFIAYFAERMIASQTAALAADRDKLSARYCEAMRGLESLTPSGSEFVGDVKRCVAFAKEHSASQMRYIVESKKRLLATEEQVKDLKARKEQLEVQLAGCGVAARGWSKDHAVPGDYGYSASYQDVLNLNEKWQNAERSNSLLRERLNAAIRLFGEIETIDQPYLVFERDFWKRITDFAAHKENQ